MPAIFAWRSAKRLTGIAAALCFALMLFTHGSVAADSVERSVLLCGRVLLPSLFPFFIVSSLLGEYLPGSALSRLAGKVFQKLFHLPNLIRENEICFLISKFLLSNLNNISLLIILR